MQKFGASSIDIQLIGSFTVNTYGEQVKAQRALVLDIVRLAEELGASFAFPARPTPSMSIYRATRPPW